MGAVSLTAVLGRLFSFARLLRAPKGQDSNRGRPRAWRLGWGLVVPLLTCGATVATLGGCGSEAGPPPITGGTTEPLPPPTNPVYGVNFGPYVLPGQQAGDTITPAQLESLLSNLRGYTEWIRTFGIEKGLEAVPPIARRLGFKTAVGAFIGTGLAVNSFEIGNLVAAAKAGTVDLAIVGNEVLLVGSQSEDALIAYIKSVRSQIPASVPVTYVDTWRTIIAHPNVVAAVDVVAVNIYPFWDGVPLDQALSALQAAYAATVQAANGKPVIIAETGWPSSASGTSVGAVPSPANEATYFSAVEAWARGSNIALFYFEAYDEAWKANSGDYSSWGIWDWTRTLKPGMADVFQK